MKKTLSLLFSTLLACAVTTVWAAPADNGRTDGGPPAQQQKNQVPNSNQNGNYLETQQDNNSDTKGSANQQDPNKPSKAGNMEKSKRFHQKPEDGGTGVKQP